MESIPGIMLKHVSTTDHSIVASWWASLENGERQEVVELFDVEREDCFFGPEAVGKELPIVLGGHFVPDDDAWRLEDWLEEWREYLVEHDDVFISSQFLSWSFGVSDVPLGEIIYSINCWADWGRTLFRNDELPLSQQLEEFGAAPDARIIMSNTGAWTYKII